MPVRTADARAGIYACSARYVADTGGFSTHNILESYSLFSMFEY